MNEPQWLSAKEYAAKFGLSTQRVTRACKKGRIPGAIQPLGPNSVWRIPNPNYSRGGR